MNRRQIWVVAIVVLLLIAIPAAYAYMLERRAAMTLGGPAISFINNPAGCIEIFHVIPRSHWEWSGRIWQEEYLPWEEIEVTGDDLPLDHGNSGPVREGDRVCGWEEYVRLVDRVTGDELARYPGCMTYRGDTCVLNYKE